MRIIGSRVGALIAALYAERHPDNVQSLFLLEPAFDLARTAEAMVGGSEAMQQWQTSGTATFGQSTADYQMVEEAATYSAYPFVRCPAYVVHGTMDEIFPIDNALKWVRAASINMRKTGDPTDEVGERRLLEVQCGSGLEGALGMARAKMIDWFGLRGAEKATPMIDLEGENYTTLRDQALPHSHNWEVYDRYVENFEAQQKEKKDMDGKATDKEDAS